MGHDQSFKLYIIGPISGFPDNNKSAFETAREKLLRANNSRTTPYEVEIPHDTIPANTSWGNALRYSINNLTARNVKGIVLLDGWDISRGAQIELQIALLLNIQVKPLDWWTQIQTIPNTFETGR